MAGARQPWYMPGLWPVGHVTSALSRSDDEKVKEPSTKPIVDFKDAAATTTSGFRAFAVAYFCMFKLYDEENPYPGFGAAKNLHFDWVFPILLRNWVGTLVVCGFWDWFLYFSPLRSKLHKYKLNKTYPSKAQILHDCGVSMFASFLAGVIEISLCYCWSNGILNYSSDLNWKVVVVGSLVTFWRSTHFYSMHRIMHPWRISGVPDIGKWLYRHVHSLHHKSFNPTAFSGTSMHPIEAFIYYTACLIPVYFGAHPILTLTAICDCGLAAWLGHDGFQWPGSSNYFHMLHHSHFDCNYGNQQIPWDWIFGSYAGRPADLKKIWGRDKPPSPEDDTSKKHASSLSKFMVQ